MFLKEGIEKRFKTAVGFQKVSYELILIMLRVVSNCDAR
jgi:hypothetical protein